MEGEEKRLQRMLVTHSVCAGACWYGSRPGAVPATGTAKGWAAHPTQRKTQRTKGMTCQIVHRHARTHTHTQMHAHTGKNTHRHKHIVNDYG